MPISDRTFDAQITQFLNENIGDSYFDIGCGAGKYGKIIKRLNPRAKLLGLEAELDYIEKYQTREIYTEVIHQRIETFIKQHPSFTTDVVIMGDLLEHLFKSDGVDVVNYFMYRCKHMVVVFPNKFVMYDFKGYATEAHNSVWTEADFINYEHKYYSKGIMNLVIVEGYLSDPDTVYNLNK